MKGISIIFLIGFYDKKELIDKRTLLIIFKDYFW